MQYLCELVRTYVSPYAVPEISVYDRVWSFWASSEKTGSILGRSDGTPLQTASKRAWAGGVGNEWAKCSVRRIGDIDSLVCMAKERRGFGAFTSFASGRAGIGPLPPILRSFGQFETHFNAYVRSISFHSNAMDMLRYWTSIHPSIYGVEDPRNTRSKRGAPATMLNQKMGC